MFQNPLFELGADRMRVELNKKSLFALASDTRLDILRALQPMRRTVTQLAESLNIDKAAVYRHLKKMEDGGLVTRYEDHGFVYYGLSWKARDLMSPNDNTRIIILLSVSWLFVFTVGFFLVMALVYGETPFVDPLDQSSEGGVPIPLLPKTDDDALYDETMDSALTSSSPMFWLVPVSILVLGTALTTFKAFTLARKPKLPTTPEKEKAETAGAAYSEVDD